MSTYSSQVGAAQVGTFWVGGYRAEGAISLLAIGGGKLRAFASVKYSLTFEIKAALSFTPVVETRFVGFLPGGTYSEAAMTTALKTLVIGGSFGVYHNRHVLPTQPGNFWSTYIVPRMIRIFLNEYIEVEMTRVGTSNLPNAVYESKAMTTAVKNVIIATSGTFYGNWNRIYKLIVWWTSTFVEPISFLCAGAGTLHVVPTALYSAAMTLKAGGKLIATGELDGTQLASFAAKGAGKLSAVADSYKTASFTMKSGGLAFFVTEENGTPTPCLEGTGAPPPDVNMENYVF